MLLHLKTAEWYLRLITEPSSLKRYVWLSQCDLSLLKQLCVIKLHALQWKGDDWPEGVWLVCREGSGCADPLICSGDLPQETAACRRTHAGTTKPDLACTCNLWTRNTWNTKGKETSYVKVHSRQSYTVMNWKIKHYWETLVWPWESCNGRGSVVTASETWLTGQSSPQ